MKSNTDTEICIPSIAAIQNPPMLMVVILSLATFTIFFQGFMIASIIPGLVRLFHVSVGHASFIEPSYLLGYGIPEKKRPPRFME